MYDKQTILFRVFTLTNICTQDIPRELNKSTRKNGAQKVVTRILIKLETENLVNIILAKNVTRFVKMSAARHALTEEVEKCFCHNV